MKKSDFIFLLSKKLKDYSETDVSLSADLIQKAIIESLKKRNRIEIRGWQQRGAKGFSAVTNEQQTKDISSRWWPWIWWSRRRGSRWWSRYLIKLLG